MGLTTKEISSSSFNDMISSVDRRSEYVENRAGANVTLNNFLTPYTLDDKSSILNAPCGYSNGVYASLRPVKTFGSELVPSIATIVNAGGGSITQISQNSYSSTSDGTSPSTVRPKFDFATTSGKTYKLVITPIGTITGTVNFDFYDGSTYLFQNYDFTTTKEITFTDNGTVFGAFDGTQTYNISNFTISIKEVTDADFDFTRGSAATRVTKDGLIKNVQILSDDLVQNGDFEEIGSELITNGDFATNLSGWTTTGTNATNTITWEPNGVRFVCVDANIGLSQLNVLTVGKTYKLTCDITVTTGGLGLDGSILVGSTINFVNGFNEIYFVANSTTFKIKRTSTVSDCLLDNVSVKEVGQNWDIGSDWQILDGKLKYNSSTASSSSLQDFNFTSGKKYKIEFEISDFTTDYRFDLYTGVSFIQSAIITSQTSFSYIFEGDGGIYLRFRGLQRGTGFSLDNVSVIEITDDTNLPRIDYTDGTGSLLLEPQSTNLQLRSQEFDNPVWSAQRATITANDAISPDGTLNAYKLTHTSGTSGYVYDTIPTVNSGDSRLISVFAKYIDDEVFKIVTFTDSGNATFNLLNGTVTSVTGTITDAKIENYGNGWYRCSCKYTATTTSTRNYGFYLDDTSKEGVHIWGAQVEAGEYATSYIPTEGSTVTRNADVCNNAGSSDLINSTEGVLYAEIAALADDGTFRMISVSDGTNDNRVRINYTATNQQIQSRVVVGGVQQAEINKFGFTNITDFTKIALSYKQNQVKLYINGELIGTDTSASMPSANTFNVLNFDGGNGSNDFYGNVRSVAVFKEALTDDELAKITSTTQQEVFYEMRDRMLQINADYYEFGDYTTRLKKLF